jgi:zinc protease
LKRLLGLALLLITSTVAAQVDTTTVSYTVSGVRVIQRRTPASIVVTNLYLLGGLRQATAQTAGLENFLLAVSERGSQKYPRDVMRRALARTGSEIDVGPREDWTVVGVHTTPAALDSTWAIFAERLMHPTLDSADVEFVREQLVSGVRQRADSPDALLDYLSDSIAYAGQPYALSSVGTETTLGRISRAQLRAYHREQIVTSRMLLVVVGDVSRGKVESLVRGTIGRLPVGSYQWTAPVAPARLGADAVILPRALPTNYLQGFIAGPAASHPDAPALRVAAAVLSGRLFAEIRSRRNLTYAVSANYRDRGLTSIALYVTTTAPDTTVALMQNEVRFLEEANIPTENLGPLVAQFITEYFLDNETTTAQADFLARAELFRGDFHAGAQFVSELRKVTGDDIKRVVKLYFHDVRWAYVGDPSRLRRDRLLNFH